MFCFCKQGIRDLPEEDDNQHNGQCFLNDYYNELTISSSDQPEGEYGMRHNIYRKMCKILQLYPISEISELL